MTSKYVELKNTLETWKLDGVAIKDAKLGPEGPTAIKAAMKALGDEDNANWETNNEEDSAFQLLKKAAELVAMYRGQSIGERTYRDSMNGWLIGVKYIGQTDEEKEADAKKIAELTGKGGRKRRKSRRGGRKSRRKPRRGGKRRIYRHLAVKAFLKKTKRRRKKKS